MALSYNLGYQESISVHPTRRQNFAGKPYSNFPNIWEWLLPAAPWGILSHLRTLKNCQTCIHIAFSFIRTMFSTGNNNSTLVVHSLNIFCHISVLTDKYLHESELFLTNWQTPLNRQWKESTAQVFGGDFSSSWGSPLVLSKLDSRTLDSRALVLSKLELRALDPTRPLVLSVSRLVLSALSWQPMKTMLAFLMVGEASSVLFVAIL